MAITSLGEQSFQLPYNLMGLPLYMQSAIDSNVKIWHLTVHCFNSFRMHFPTSILIPSAPLYGSTRKCKVLLQGLKALPRPCLPLQGISYPTFPHLFRSSNMGGPIATLWAHQADLPRGLAVTSVWITFIYRAHFSLCSGLCSYTTFPEGPI